MRDPTLILDIFQIL